FGRGQDVEVRRRGRNEEQGAAGEVAPEAARDSETSRGGKTGIHQGRVAFRQAARGNTSVVMPSGLPKDSKDQFDRAVAAFRGEGPVRVTPQKLTVYLDQTRHIEAPPAQRLRWLAIELEHARFERGWDDLRTIYQAAADAAPADPWVLHSWGLSASRWVEG